MENAVENARIAAENIAVTEAYNSRQKRREFLDGLLLDAGIPVADENGIRFDNKEALIRLSSEH